MSTALVALAIGFGLAIVASAVALTLARRGRRTDNTRDDWDVD